MTKIPNKLKREMAADPFYSVCARRAALRDHECHGRITWEHSLIHAGNQVQKKFAIIPLCEWAHSVNYFQDSGGLNKEINVWIALNRASDVELKEISKAIDYIRLRAVLNELYGEYKPVQIQTSANGINY